MSWGIIPKWADVKSRALINARCESVREKRSFKQSFVEQRCLVPADGFYEWTKVGKRPHLFTLNGDAPFAIAAIYEQSENISPCCLLTTSANAVLEPIHDRMPVIVRREDWDEWFSTGELVEQSFQRVTAPYHAEEMSALAVSTLVNSARMDDEKCCEPELVQQKLVITRAVRDDSMGQQTLGF